MQLLATFLCVRHPKCGGAEIISTLTSRKSWYFSLCLLIGVLIGQFLSLSDTCSSRGPDKMTWRVSRALSLTPVTARLQQGIHWSKGTKKHNSCLRDVLKSQCYMSHRKKSQTALWLNKTSVCAHALNLNMIQTENIVLNRVVWIVCMCLIIFQLQIFCLIT